MLASRYNGWGQVIKLESQMPDSSLARPTETSQVKEIPQTIE